MPALLRLALATLADLCRFARRSRRLAIVLALPGLLAMPAQALDSSLNLSDYRHDIWTARNGGPGGVTTMAQTPDGWLWLGTDKGLFRFDGVRFEAFQPHPGEKLLGNRIGSLFAASNGDLWIGYSFGSMSQLHQGRLQHHPVDPKLPLLAYEFTEDEQGGIWVASHHGLQRWWQGRWERQGKGAGLEAELISNVFMDHRNRLWTSDGKLAYLRDPATGRFNPAGEVLPDAGFALSPDGSVWSANATQAKRLSAPAAPASASALHKFNQVSGHYGMFDRDGNFWAINCPKGLCHVQAGQWQQKDLVDATRQATSRLDQPWQVSDLNALLTLEDREGNIWVATWNGLERFRHNRFVQHRFPPETSMLTLAQDAAGDIWATARKPHGQAWRLPDTQNAISAPDANFSIVTPDGQGGVILGGDKYLEIHRHGKVERILLPPELTAPGVPNMARSSVLQIVDDGTRIWIIVQGRGLHCYENGQWLSNTKTGIPKGRILLGSDKEGGLWFSNKLDLLLRYAQGKFTEYGPAQGLEIGLNLRMVDRENLIFSGEGGVARLVGGRFQTLHIDDDRVLANVSGSLSAANGDRWFNGELGLLQIKASEWQRFLADPTYQPVYELFDELDGYPGSTANYSRAGTVVQARDGKLWLTRSDGLAWLDPAKLYRNPYPPPVQITALSADHQAYRFDAPIVLAAGNTNLQIDYTALSYVQPERIRFRYRLEGVDADWQDVGNRRSAFYTNLQPGKYRFRVQAVNEDGVWNTVGASLPFELAPTFLQSRIFVALCALLALGLAYLFYRWRISQITAQAHLRLTERERIARALHDTLLQGVQGLVLRIQAVATQLRDKPDIQAQLNQALDRADQVLAAGRDQVMDLRTSADLSDDIAVVLLEIGNSIAADHPASFALLTEGKPARLKPAVKDEAYSILREAMGNAFRHAEASEVELRLNYTPEHWEVQVRDNGKGLPMATLDAGRRPGHWGIVGMRERAARIGGQLVLRNRAGGGAEVVLTVPAKFAYAPSLGSGWLHRLLRWAKRA